MWFDITKKIINYRFKLSIFLLDKILKYNKFILFIYKKDRSLFAAVFYCYRVKHETIKRIEITEAGNYHELHFLRNCKFNFILTKLN